MVDRSVINVMIYLVCAFLGGLVGYKMRIPAGTIIFSLLAVASAKLLMGDGGQVPGYLNFLSQCLIGLIIGLQFNQNVLKEVSGLWVYMVLSVVILMIVGLIYAIILAKMDCLSLPTAYLATSPGALSAMVFMSVDQGTNIPLVAIFHLTRIFLILLAGPFVLKIIEYLSA